MLRALALCSALAVAVGCAALPTAEVDGRRVAGRLGAVVASGFVVPPPPAAPSEVTQTINDRTYPVEGSTWDEVRASIHAASPFRDDDARRTFHGFATSDIRWTLQYVPDRFGCRVDDLQVRLTQEVTVYDWTAPPGVAPGVVATVRSESAALLTHERGHQTIGLLAALDLTDALRGASAPGCDALRARVGAASERVLGDHRAVQQAYDEATRHGAAPSGPPGRPLARSASGGGPLAGGPAHRRRAPRRRGASGR